MKPLFQRQCEALVKTLTKAKADKNVTLDMHTWVDKNHTCGTAVCICGYQALSNDLNLFYRAKDRLYKSEDCYYKQIAIDISTDLDASCEELFGNESLARSIYMDGISRHKYARVADVADEETLKTFNHLTSDDPSLDDAIEYIEFVIQKCKEKAE